MEVPSAVAPTNQQQQQQQHQQQEQQPLPIVFAQPTDRNERICSLLSAFLIRRVRSLDSTTTTATAVGEDVPIHPRSAPTTAPTVTRSIVIIILPVKHWPDERPPPSAAAAANSFVERVAKLLTQTTTTTSLTILRWPALDGPWCFSHNNKMHDPEPHTSYFLLADYQQALSWSVAVSRLPPLCGALFLHHHHHHHGLHRPSDSSWRRNLTHLSIPHLVLVLQLSETTAAVPAAAVLYRANPHSILVSVPGGRTDWTATAENREDFPLIVTHWVVRVLRQYIAAILATSESWSENAMDRVATTDSPPPRSVRYPPTARL